MSETITLGNNLTPPVANAEVTQNIYDCVRTDEFDVAAFNSLLLAVVIYCDAHDVDYADGGLPWAESIEGGEQ